MQSKYGIWVLAVNLTQMTLNYQFVYHQDQKIFYKKCFYELDKTINGYNLRISTEKTKLTIFCDKQPIR